MEGAAPEAQVCHHLCVDQGQAIHKGARRSLATSALAHLTQKHTDTPARALLHLEMLSFGRVCT